MSGCCGCCIQIDTPQSIKDEGNDYYPEDTDIFAEIFDNSTLTNAELMQTALWASYRLRMIGSCNTPEWVQAMRDRLTIIGPKWDDIMTEAAQTVMTDMDADSYVRTIQRTAIEGTEGDVRTVRRTGTISQQGSNTGTVTTVDTPTGSDIRTEEHESLPQTPTTDTKYLDSRDTITETPGVVRANQRTDNLENGGTTTNNLTDTDTYEPNTQDKETYNESRDIMAKTFSEMMREYPDILGGFAREFDMYFLPVIG